MRLLPVRADNRRTQLLIVLLAGALRPSPLRPRLEITVLCLPLTASRTLLDGWLNAIDNTPGEKAVKIVVSSASDASLLRRELESRHPARLAQREFEVEVIVDPAQWRGPGGLISDIVSRFPVNHVQHHGVEGEGMVVVAEAACVPPDSIELLTRRLKPEAPGVSGVSADSEPAGLYVFNHEAISLIPRVGYFDLKEQLLPALHAKGRPIPAVPVVERVQRVWDRESYLSAVRSALDVSGEDGLPESISATAEVAPTAHVIHPCIISRNVSIEAGAVVHASVILDGASIGSGAIVLRSVIGPGCEVPAGAVVRSDVVAASVGGAPGSTHARRVPSGVARVRSRLPVSWFAAVRGDR